MISKGVGCRGGPKYPLRSVLCERGRSRGSRMTFCFGTNSIAGRGGQSGRQVLSLVLVEPHKWRAEVEPGFVCG